MSATASTSARNKHSESVFENTKIDITKEEFSRIKKALEKEEFRKLFLEYVEEIQDPKNRQLYQDEIVQFEKERGVDCRFINPEPGFVVKTAVNGERKCFVNIAKCAEVPAPTSETGVNAATGTRGLNWSIPLAQAAPRDDVDAHNKLCSVYDVIFHPDALHLANKNAAFRKCLIDTALDAIERDYKVTLDRANLKFPKLAYKGVARASIVRKLSESPDKHDEDPHPLENIYPPKPTAESQEPQVMPLKTQPTPKPDFTTPKYVIKHRRDVDLAEYTNELDAKLNATVPRTLAVEIELPLLTSTAECQLDVTDKSLYLLSERPGAKYRLKLELPYTVNDKEGNARFDTDERKLCVTLPVVQLSSEKQRIMHDSLRQLCREDSGVELHSNSESPVEEEDDEADVADDDLSDTHDGDEPIVLPAERSITEKCSPVANAAPSTPTSPRSFLKSSIQYQFPAKFDCNVLDNVMSIVLRVRNVQQDSVAMLRNAGSIHLRFTSIGSGYYPSHYAYYLRLPADAGNFVIVSAEADAWENNLVLNLNLNECSEKLESYLAGLDSNDLKEYFIHEEFQLVNKARQQKPLPADISCLPRIAPTLNVSVERSECEQSLEIEIKPMDEQQSSACAANTTEDEDQHNEGQQIQQKKLNKKQRKRNKKRRSLSESACDDLKAYHADNETRGKKSTMIKAADNAAQDEDSSPERPDRDVMERAKLAVTGGGGGSNSMAVPAVREMSAQQRKQRSYSESHHDLLATSSSLGSNSNFKGILKRFSRYMPRSSISDSCSSICDSENVSYSCSIEGNDMPARYSHSFSGIPEENNAANLSESCKKTVRFNDTIMKQVFRLDSSILGQRKKNQKRRDRKQRALQRRLSEGDSADYVDDDNSKGESASQYFKENFNNKNKNDGKSNNQCSVLDVFNNNSGKTKATKSKEKKCSALEVNGSASDSDTVKNSMMFEMDDDDM